jgi:hypothetical protein
VVLAYIKHQERKKIKQYVRKIFEFYIKEKKIVSSPRYKDIQFIFLRELQKNQKIKDVVELVNNELYSTKADIARNLKEHVQMLEKANTDIRLLGVQYILELIEQPEHDDIRQVLMSSDVLRVVYHGILKMN